jgi:hypothetical protein
LIKLLGGIPKHAVGQVLYRGKSFHIWGSFNEDKCRLGRFEIHLRENLQVAAKLYKNHLINLGSMLHMITIFCDFSQFSAKNWRFSQIPML